ncbi:MAG TPA: sigma 54-interacting transcriptional regulator, partial [Gemmatimonadaceae bacterium]|nr:sigma 54-interacting transcriptional regulator [Gemmatimonadaceae bacterium]
MTLDAGSFCSYRGTGTGMLTPERVDAQRSIAPSEHHPHRSNAYVLALAMLDRYARSGVPVLIEGESGTGKTLLARRVHDQSPRVGRAYHAVALSSVDDTLAGSELFGHVVGAFTDARASRAGMFASAHGGTLFLDEIGKASPVVQRRLLHAIEAHQVRPMGTDRDVAVDVRIVAATNIPLATLVDQGSFLPDLYARLETFRVRVPPLRERQADIPDLVRDAVRAHSTECGYTTPPEIEPALLQALQHERWPNNLRQLDAAVYRLLLDAEGAGVLTLAMYPHSQLEQHGHSQSTRAI